ncbi:TonB-dependent receptor [Novosphingobium sp. FKTRR1]|uniref:TonB-dependent receptor n=1 Tax=Novosphingobium sp. FKTRR1 TaxID=2879118 RepID=UPI001CF04566|nr:TonB-dependent receptor [Novosphingobium sp. FKTRR1]
MRMISKDRWRLSQAAIVGTMLSSVAIPALAQEAPAPAEAAAAPLAAGEIVVTATRRSESLQKVPISIQALSTATLEQRQVQSFDDYAKMLPSVSFNSFGPGQSQVYFRGINSGGDGLDVGSLPTVGSYIDEIPVTTVGNSVDIHLYDIQRIEALAGPQGTLFGASSLAGTLRIITNKPSTGKFEAGYDLQVNKYGKGGAGGTAEAFVNVPISANAAIRLVGYYKREGGFIDNTYKQRTYSLDDPDPNTNVTIDNAKFVGKDQNTVDTYGGRAALKVDLDSDWSVTPQLIYQKQISHGSWLFDPAAGDLKVHDFLDSFNRDELAQASLTIQGKIGNWDVTYAGSYFDRHKKSAIDYSYYTVAYDHYSLAGGYAAAGDYYFYTKYPDGKGGYLNPNQFEYQNMHFTKQTHELRFSSPADAPVRLTFGAFMQRQQNKIATDFATAGITASGVPITDFPNQGLYPLPGFPDAVFLKRLDRVDRDYAVFAEENIDITSSLTLTGGIRFFSVDNTLYGFSGIAGLGRRPSRCVATSDSFYPCISVNKQYKEQGETHKISLSWKIDPSRMIYATYSTGFRPGGNDRRPGTPSFLADTLTNYELGWKTSWLGNSIRFNGAVFHEKWQKIQFTLPGANGQNYLLNAPGGAEVNGVESDIAYYNGGFSLTGSAAYIDAKLADDFCNARGCTPKGTQLPATPKFKGNVTARYAWNDVSWKPFIQASANHQSGTRAALLDSFVYDTVNYLGQTVSQFGFTKAFTTFDFSAGLSFGDIKLEAYIQNAFDKRGILSKASACGLAECRSNARFYPIKPQLFGIKASQRF